MIQAGVGNTVHMVPIDEVLYFEAADKYVRVITAEREHLIRMSLRELLPQLDPAALLAGAPRHRGARDAIASALRDESGKVTLTLRGRAERLTASRLYAHFVCGDVGGRRTHFRALTRTGGEPRQRDQGLPFNSHSPRSRRADSRPPSPAAGSPRSAPP